MLVSAESVAKCTELRGRAAVPEHQVHIVNLPSAQMSPAHLKAREFASQWDVLHHCMQKEYAVGNVS